jgi:hypothetical protein
LQFPFCYTKSAYNSQSVKNKLIAEHLGSQIKNSEAKQINLGSKDMLCQYRLLLTLKIDFTPSKRYFLSITIATVRLKEVPV